MKPLIIDFAARSHRLDGADLIERRHQPQRLGGGLDLPPISGRGNSIGTTGNRASPFPNRVSKVGFGA